MTHGLADRCGCRKDSAAAIAPIPYLPPPSSQKAASGRLGQWNRRKLPDCKATGGGEAVGPPLCAVAARGPAGKIDFLCAALEPGQLSLSRHNPATAISLGPVRCLHKCMHARSAAVPDAAPCEREYACTMLRSIPFVHCLPLQEIIDDNVLMPLLEINETGVGAICSRLSYARVASRQRLRCRCHHHFRQPLRRPLFVPMGLI